MGKLIRPNHFSEFDPAPGAVAVFGGTFDPIHTGHISVVQALLTLFSKVVIAPTERNPWKGETEASLSQRIEMIRLVLRAEKLDEVPLSDSKSPGVRISETPYVFVAEAIEQLQDHFQSEIYWAVGEDSADSVNDWKDWDKLDLIVLALPVTINIHATEIRKSQKPLHPSLEGYTRKHGLYGRPLSS